MSKYFCEVKRALPTAPPLPDFAIDGEYSLPRSSSHYLRGSSGNPTYISSKELLAPNVKHVFLIRTPEKSVPSWARLGRREDIGCGFFDQEQLGVHQSATFYRFLAQKLADPPLIIDSDDVFDNTEAIVRELCRLMGVEFESCMLHWQDDPSTTELFSKWEGEFASIRPTMHLG